MAADEHDDEKRAATDKGPDIRRELNQLWRSTIDQFDEIKDAIVRSGTAGKTKLDATMTKRQRDKLLAEIGERVLELCDDGELTLPPALTKSAERVRELEREIEAQEREVERLLRHEPGAKREDADEG